MSVRANIPFRLNAMTTVNLTIDTAIEKPESMPTICDDGHPPSRVKMPKTCIACAGTGPFKVGREINGQLAVLTEADTEAIATAITAGKAEAVLTVHQLTDVLTATLPGSGIYYALPGKGQDLQYNALRRMVEMATGKGQVLCTVLGLKGPIKPWRLGIFHDAITLNEIAWPEAIRRQPDIPSIPISERDEESLSLTLASLETPFVATDYRNTVEALKTSLLAAAVGSTPQPAATPSATPTNITSFFEGLRAVKEAAAPVKKAAVRKTAAKKVSPIRKSA